MYHVNKHLVNTKTVSMATAETPQRKTSSKRSRNHQSPASQVNADQTAAADNMAETTALTNGSSHRHQHHHHRHHHHHCNHGNQEQPEKSEKSKSKNRPTKQLDFDQAMADFKTMFPTMDCEIIEAVLRANDGAVDSTIDQLLTMSIDSENNDPDFEIPPELLSPVSIHQTQSLRIHVHMCCFNDEGRMIHVIHIVHLKWYWNYLLFRSPLLACFWAMPLHCPI